MSSTESRAIAKNLGDSYSIQIDSAPGWGGSHRRVKISHKGRVVASMRVSAFRRAVEAFEKVQEGATQ